MPNREIVDYIKKELRNGFHISDIKAALYKAGHKAEHVEESVEHIYHHHAHMHTAIVLTVVLLVSLFVILGYNLFNSTHVVELNYDSEVVEIQETEFDVEDAAFVGGIINTAVLTNNITFCDMLELEENHATCLSRYYTKQAVKQNYAPFCDLIPILEDIELCKEKVAKNEN